MKLTSRVPATTANVGSGFDCVGIALDWYDELTLEVGDAGGVRIDVTGEGAGQVPRDASHLVIRSLAHGLGEWGGRMPGGLHLTAHNTIPHSRGLGSSAAAIVAGLAFAWGIARPGVDLDRVELARVSSLLEGHPDNAGAAVWGGACLGWMDVDGVELIDIRVHPDLVCQTWVPRFEVPTAGARAVLPVQVPRIDAVQQAISSATLMLALQSRPELLLRATRDTLHQDYRAPLMRESHDLMTALRKVGVPATISGAGPALFAIGTAQQLDPSENVPAPGFQVSRLSIGAGVSLRSFL